MRGPRSGIHLEALRAAQPAQPGQDQRPARLWPEAVLQWPGGERSIAPSFLTI
jgi:hypothetical protein